MARRVVVDPGHADPAAARTAVVEALQADPRGWAEALAAAGGRA